MWFRLCTGIGSFTALAVTAAPVGVAVAPRAIAVNPSASLSTELASASTEATAYHVDPGHTGYSSAPLIPPLSRRWEREFPATVSYPLIAQRRVFVTVQGSTRQDTRLLALKQATGRTVWVQQFPGYSFPLATYDQSRVYVITKDGQLTAFNADNGHLMWRRDLSRRKTYIFSTAPTAVAGSVYVSGSGVGGTVYRVDADTGRLVWRVETVGSESTPSVAGGVVSVAYAEHHVYGIDASSGSVLWHHGGFAHGGGNTTTTAYRGRVYAPDTTGLVLDSTTGRVLDSFYATTQPAVQRDLLLLLEGQVLHAVRRTDQADVWSFPSPGRSRLATSPLIVNDFAYVGTRGGTLLAVRMQTGELVWRSTAGPGMYSPLGRAMPDLAAGGELLVVPAQNRLVAYAD